MPIKTIAKEQPVVGKMQRGAALIISLIMLVALTFLGIAGMNASVLQERMAANTQNSYRAFEAAESAADALIADVLAGNMSALEEAMAAADAKSTSASFNIGRADVTASNQAAYLGEVAMTSGSSMDASESAPILKGFRFEAAGSATIDDTGAQRTVRKGIEYD